MNILKSLEKLTIESNVHIQEYFSEKVCEINSSDITALYDYEQSSLELSIRRNLKRDGFKNVGCYLSYSNGKDYLTLTINLDTKNPYINPFEIKPTKALLDSIKILEAAYMVELEDKIVLFKFIISDNRPNILELKLTSLS